MTKSFCERNQFNSFIRKLLLMEPYSVKFSLLMAFATEHSEFSSKLAQQLQCRLPVLKGKHFCVKKNYADFERNFI